MYGTKKKKQPERKMKECPADGGKCQHELPKRVAESKKIKPKEVFATVPKKGKKSGY
tara:strand:+ start:2112 stop:2282 length:171 start_codon:yes stop_codon:yes gene_type:complete